MSNVILATNPDHAAAALSFKRAANAKRHALMFPTHSQTYAREMDSVRFWRRCASHHQTMAAFNSTRAVRTWDFPNWRDEVNWLLSSSRSATLAGVE